MADRIWASIMSATWQRIHGADGTVDRYVMRSNPRITIEAEYASQRYEAGRFVKARPCGWAICLDGVLANPPGEGYRALKRAKARAEAASDAALRRWATENGWTG